MSATAKVTALADEDCPACKGGMPRLKPAEVAPLGRQVRAWRVVKRRELRREFKFKDFARALAFVNAIGREAEKLGHHPDLELGWGRVAIALSTHSAGGLSRADFVLAARIDRLHARGARAMPGRRKRGTRPRRTRSPSSRK